MEDTLHGHVHPLFYEPIDSVPLGPDYLEHLRGLLPGDWELRRWDVWLGAAPAAGVDLVPHGFKIHVSSTPRHASRTLDLVVPELVERGISFKITGDPSLLNLLISKRYGRGGAGKFMTIYPPHTDAFKELIEALYRKTAGEGLVGPYILSDRRYKNSRILYYRYGGHRSSSELTAMGTQRSVIRAPGGEEVPDERTPYFRLPSWVEDPFGGTPALESPGEPILNGRYRVDSVIVFSNAGGVYRGTDLQAEREVILKEARPYAHYWAADGHEVDAVAILEREFQVIERLFPLGFVPEPIDLFTAWEHTFLVEGFVSGISFQEFWNGDENILAPYIRRPGRLERFCVLYRDFARRLSDAVSRIHGRGVILGDLSTNNVLVDPATLDLSFIDFESAFMPGQAEAFAAITRQWGTAGFVNLGAREARDALCEEDDWYAVGMLLYATFCPVQNFFTLVPDARDFLLDRFVELGLPRRVPASIRAFLEGRPEEALRILDEWDAEEPLDVSQYLTPAEEPELPPAPPEAEAEANPATELAYA